MTPKKSIAFVMFLVLLTAIFVGCGSASSSELEVLQEEIVRLQEENTLLKAQLFALGETIPPSISDSETTSIPDEKSFETLVFSGTGDKVITDVNLPEGVFITTISIDSTEYYAVKYHFADDYELLVNDSGEAYCGSIVIKGNTTEPVNDGMLEIESKGTWQITIDKLSDYSTTNIKGQGDKVTGIFNGTGANEVVSIAIESNEYYAVKLYEYDLINNDLEYDLLVNDSGEPYHGESVAKLKSDKYYFLEISSKGDWAIDFGHGDSVTEYYETTDFPNTVNQNSTSEPDITKEAEMPAETVVIAETEVVAENETTKKEAQVNFISMAETTLETVRGLTKNDLVEKEQFSGISYYYKGIVLQSEDVKSFDSPWNKEGNVNQDAIYNTLAKHLVGFEVGFNDGSAYSNLIIGHKTKTREEFEPYANIVSEFICVDDSLYHVLKKLETLDSVSGTFDYKNDMFNIEISSLSKCSKEMMISEEMLGYIFGLLDCYAFEINFDGDTCQIKYEALFDFGWN